MCGTPKVKTHTYCDDIQIEPPPPFVIAIQIIWTSNVKFEIKKLSSNARAPISYRVEAGDSKRCWWGAAPSPSSAYSWFSEFRRGRHHVYDMKAGRRLQLPKRILTLYGN
ncbi:hypothetical protein EVAR_82084_1 [Eumeta japonica]|uniref:Uncharacterized protein n=1 Tax=Eumeta variegata TaxID=151549 RepID=A0A4C1U1M5_EUMVA|nr:hypothetical protein EVAR_82084_1 [Eumeta japonica]